MSRANVLVGAMVNAHWLGAGIVRMAQSPSGEIAMVCVNDLSDVVWTRSVDGGLSWEVPTTVFTGTAGQLATWYDRDSGIDGELLHCVYTDTVNADVLYRNVNISSGAMSAQTTVFAGDSYSNSVPTIDVTRARSGNLVCVGAIDAGVETFAMRSTDVGANWSSIASPMEASTNDFVILMPGWGADDKGIMCFFWDASADEVSVKYFDDSGGGSWVEQLISTGMVNSNHSADGYPHWAAAVDLANGRNVLIVWSGVDVAGADLRCWTAAGDHANPVVAARTDVITDSPDNQGSASLSIDAKGHWWGFYLGKSDGSETYETSVNIYSKVSTDTGSTWGPETQVTDSVRAITWAGSCMHFNGVPPVAYSLDNSVMMINVSLDSAAQTVGARWNEGLA